MRIRITHKLAADFQARDVYHDLWKPGAYQVSDQRADEMRRDAEFQSEYHHGFDVPPQHQQAYRALLRQLDATPCRFPGCQRPDDQRAHEQQEKQHANERYRRGKLCRHDSMFCHPWTP